MAGIKAAARVPSRAETILLILQLERFAAAARAAGVAVPESISPWLDAVGRQSARAWLDAAMRIPQVMAAVRDTGHPAHAIVDAVRNMLLHEAFDRGARPDGTPTPSTEPVSSGLVLYASGLQQRVDVSELTPAEAAVAAALGAAHPDFRNDAQQAELEALHARAATALEATETPVPGSSPGTTESAAQGATEGTQTMTQPTERIAELNRLLRDTRMSAPDRHILVDELAGLLSASEIPAGAPLPDAAATPNPSVSGARGAAAAKEFTVTAPRGAGLTEKSIALTDQLRGMKFHGASERQAVLGELAQALLDAEPTGEP